MYEKLFSPINLGGLELKNRVIFAPTSMSLEGEGLERLKRIAAGGCAMVIVGDVPVSKRGPFTLHEKKGFEHYRAVCAAIHAGGALACAQLHQSDSNFKAMLKYIPALLAKRITADDLRAKLNAETGTYITGLSTDRVSEITASFGPAAVLAAEAGFDMVQVHGDRMCGSFSSAVYNARTDRYGGSVQNRTAFAVEAVSAVRRALPGIPIDYKLAVRQENPHYGNAGVLLEELPLFVPALERAGVSSFHVTLANHAALADTIPPSDHPYFAEEGCFLRYCDEVGKYATKPRCGVGGLTDPDFVEEQLAAGRIDCAAMSRQLLADPDWPRKAQEGRTAEIRRCIRCNRDCLGGIQAHRGVHCIYDKEH